MFIDIVIVNWNSGDQLFECVESIMEYHRPSVSKIIVVDNNSIDGSEKKVNGIPQVQLIKSSYNLGFSKACNLGAKYANNDLILFLNPDTRLFLNSFNGISKFMDLNQNAGILGIQLLNDEGSIAKSCSRFPSALSYFYSALGFDLIFPKTGKMMNEWDHLTTCAVDQVIGAFFLIRRNLFIDLNGFDERFFMYYEEVDLSLRAKNIGLESYYYANAQAFHKGGGTSEKVKALRLFYSLKSRLLFTKKNLRLHQFISVFFITMIIEFFTRIIHTVFRLSLSSFKETLLAYFLLYKWVFNKTIFKVFPNSENL